MKVILGLVMFILGMYLYNKEIRKVKVAINKFNAIWKYRNRWFVYALLIGGVLFHVLLNLNSQVLVYSF
ncbi:hypothetical protein [Belliella aquatica]|uniref:Uncharacterized protein n=1 Tax=Belliella aquatica TaxID=1323734 RepID=A0ABQ1MWG8_9BACT|nr:hypothetical protein [Belliella aquatica]MCH7406212.1 hypothetical protein [Belliella aquatica]GGC44361.1 hypothetical protein GCM10010993_23580 [Belliella aquatica]